MWSVESVEIVGFKALPSLSSSLKEFISDLQRVSPHHSGFSGKLVKEGDRYKIKLCVENGTSKIEQSAESTNVYEAVYFVFQAIFAKLIEAEHSKIQALPIKKLKKIRSSGSSGSKKYVS